MELNEIIDQDIFLISLSFGCMFIYLFSKRPKLVKKMKL